jgi:hypothetical protein
MCGSGRQWAAPLAIRTVARWLRGRISTRRHAWWLGRVPTEWFAWLAGAGDDYTYERNSPPWGVTMDHLSFDVVFR